MEPRGVEPLNLLTRKVLSLLWIEPLHPAGVESVPYDPNSDGCNSHLIDQQASDAGRHSRCRIAVVLRGGAQVGMT